MKKIIRYITGIILIVTFLGIVYSTLNYAQAIPEKEIDKFQPGTPPGTPFYPRGFLTQRVVPIYCGDTAFMFQTAFEIFGEELIAGATVTKQGFPETEVVGILSFSHNELANTGTFLITLPDTGETCILGFGRDWQFYKILDEGNESK